MFKIFDPKPGAAPWEARIALLGVLFVIMFALANSGTECARADASCQVGATAQFSSGIEVGRIDSNGSGIGFGAVADASTFLNINPTFSRTTPVVFLLEGAVTSTDDGGAPKFAQIGGSGASITTAFAGADTVVRISTVEVFEPNITLGATGGQDVVTSAQTLYIGDAPTEATAGGNHAISMPSGAFNVSDGQGTAGEQLTSGGQDANVTWTSAASVRSSKKEIVPNTATADALAKMIAAGVYQFKYKPTTWKTVEQIDRKGNVYKVRIPVDRVPSTGDFDTTYVGIMADEVPWAMHYNGTVLNPINTFGYTVLAIQELNALIEDLDARIAVLEATR